MSIKSLGSTSAPLLFLTLVATTPGGTLLGQNNAQKGPPSKALQLRIEMSQTSYRLGDSINVRLTLRNTSGQAVEMPGAAAQSLAYLRVLDSAGNAVKSRGEGISLALSGMTLRPGKEITLTSVEGKEWVNLRDWGYDTLSPGKYTLEGTPAMGETALTAKDRSVRSNRISFTIKG